ncbi:hypothetical protein [Polyangium jinanense]|uniref:Uncharacterized protein n=1 Tax=Polyangium jinanense TaxID=2829994 RepID=A0A9X3XG46_9BACT|nr:hypothetical protein [Polyangium jinanense]MDC3962069.1 hypothetical protein [Polyangium jinanense]MDC3988785.1 hypothetical protein [Polyangium jinanense]
MVRRTALVLAIGLANVPAALADDETRQQASAVATNPRRVCWKPGQGRGAGDAPTTCEPRKEFQGGLCYSVCPSGMTGEGPVCWSICPAGYADEGLLCRKGLHVVAKQSMGRGTGEAPRCAAGQEPDGSLCYAPCPAGHTGAGPVCWPACGSDYPASCGALCAVSSTACAEVVGEMVSQGLLVGLEAILTQRIDPQALADLAKAFAWPMCEGR